MDTVRKVMPNENLHRVLSSLGPRIGALMAEAEALLKSAATEGTPHTRRQLRTLAKQYAALRKAEEAISYTKVLRVLQKINTGKA